LPRPLNDDGRYDRIEEAQFRALLHHKASCALVILIEMKTSLSHFILTQRLVSVSSGGVAFVPVINVITVEEVSLIRRHYYDQTKAIVP